MINNKPLFNKQLIKKAKYEDKLVWKLLLHLNSLYKQSVIFKHEYNPPKKIEQFTYKCLPFKNMCLNLHMDNDNAIILMMEQYTKVNYFAYFLTYSKAASYEYIPLDYKLDFYIGEESVRPNILVTKNDSYLAEIFGTQYEYMIHELEYMHHYIPLIIDKIDSCKIHTFKHRNDCSPITAPPLPIIENKIQVLNIGNDKRLISEPKFCRILPTRSPRVHLRRGHTRTYKSGKTIWVNEQVVGKKTGIVNKTYSVEV